ncbi:hypothetical protein V501_01920 [Pseudogymnoascus sp. VKM F-4519 (FW-2642)]|nr:hypothetical protein V501_01920 [Pseudogymnoascus sp. VKM F-4519 (FW-2642)]
MLLLAPSSSAAGTESTTSAPTPTPTTTVNDATESTSSASTTAPDSTMSPTKSTGTSESSTSAPSSQCSSTPNSKYIIAQSSAGCDKEGSSSSIMSTLTMTETTTTSSTTTSASVGATAEFAEDTFYRLSNLYLSAGYSLTIENDKGILSRKLNMAITGADGGQYWQIKRIPNTDDQYWFACQFLGKDVRLFLDPSDQINPLMAAADDTAVGQQWNVQSMGDGAWGISNVLGNWGISNVLGNWGSNVLGDLGAQLSTYSNTHELFMSMEHDTGTVWSITAVRKITVADDFL